VKIVGATFHQSRFAIFRFLCDLAKDVYYFPETLLRLVL
jgi:hypothetical protein